MNGNTVKMDRSETVKIVQKLSKDIGINPGPLTIMAFMGASPDSLVNTAIRLSDHTETVKADKQLIQVNKKNYSEIETAIVDMLTENTGIAMCDSGGVNGRSWQRNRLIDDFRTETPLTLSMDYTDLEFSFDIFTYLTEQLDTDETAQRLEKEFYNYCESENERPGFYMLEDWINQKRDMNEDIEFYYGEHTYNRDNILSQDIQYNIFEYDGFHYCSLQIHNGADARGGMTKPRFYAFNGSYGETFNNDGSIDARCDCVNIYSDEHGYRWDENTDNRDTPTQLNLSGELVELEPVLTTDRDLPKFWLKEPNDKTVKVYSGDDMLRCSYCGAVVDFRGCV